MYERILYRMRANVREGNYSIIEHAHDNAIERDISGFEIEKTILNGQIIEHQRDSISGESKYIIREQIFQSGLEVVAKFGPTGRLFIITVYSI